MLASYSRLRPGDPSPSGTTHTGLHQDLDQGPVSGIGLPVGGSQQVVGLVGLFEDGCMEGGRHTSVDGLLLQAGAQARNHQHGPPMSSFQELLESILRILIAGEYRIGDICIR